MIWATFCAIIPLAPVVQVLPLERRSDRTSVFETGLTRACHEPAIGATKSPRLVGLRRSLARIFPESSRRKVTDGGQFWHRLDQQSHTFSDNFQSRSDSNARDVAARSRDACHKSYGNRIDDYRHNWDCRRRHFKV